MASYNKKQDFEQWLSEHDPDSKKYKYRDKSAYSYIREQKETASIPRTREVERAYAENPAGWENSKNMQAASVVPRAEDYRAAAYAYSVLGRQQKPIATSRNPRSSYYNPNWQKEISARKQAEREAAQRNAEKLAEERVYPKMEVDKNSAGYKKYGDKWTRALTLSTIPNLNKDEKREAAEILKQLQSDYTVVDQTDVFFSPDMPSDMWKTYIDLYNKSNAGAGITTGFIDAFGAPGLLDKGFELASGMLDEEYTPGSVKEQFSRIGSAHPNAYSVGKVAGSLVSMLAAGKAVGAGLGTISGFGKLPKLLQGAIRSGATMGLSEAVSEAANMPTKREWDISEANKKEFLASSPGGGIDYTPKDYSFLGQVGDVLRKTGIRTVGGFAGGLAGGAIGELGKAVLVKHGLQTPFAEVMRQAASGTAFSAADIGSTYFLLPKEERPNSTEIAQQVATSFLFSVLEGSISTISTTKQNRAKLENAVGQMQSEYSSMLKGKSPEEQIAALKNITELNKNIRGAISQHYYAGQQDAINDILQTLDAIDEEIGLIQRGITSGSSGSTPANATSPVPTSPSPAGNYPAPIGNSTAPTNSSEVAKQALAQAAAWASQTQPPENIRQAASQAAENAAQSVQEQSPVDIQREAAQGVAGNEVEPSTAANRTPANENINRVAETAAKAAQTQPPTNIQEAAAQAAEKAAQSAIKPETKNNTTHTAKDPTTGVATNETAAQPEANQETDKAKTAATALDNITKAGAMNTPYEAVTDAYKEMVSTGVITLRELSDAYATGLAEYNKSHADTTGDNEYATKIANALSTLNKYVDNGIQYTIRGNDNWGYTAAVTRIRDNNGGVPIENARDTLFIMSGLKTRQDAVDALVGVSHNFAPVGTTQETVSPTEAPKVERKPPNDAMIQKLDESILGGREESVDGSAQGQNTQVRAVQEVEGSKQAEQAGVRGVPERDTQSGIQGGSGSLQGELPGGQRNARNTEGELGGQTHGSTQKRSDEGVYEGQNAPAPLRGDGREVLPGVLQTELPVSGSEGAGARLSVLREAGNEGTRRADRNDAAGSSRGRSLGDRQGVAVPEGRGEHEVGLEQEAKAEIERTVTEKPKGANFVIGEKLDLPAGEKARYKANVAAIKIVKNLIAENRYATAEEQEALSKYVGWGGLSSVFDAKKEGWAKEYNELQALLTPEEYKAARASTLNAHYTSIDVIRAMYEGLKHLGFQGGRMLEPSGGIGHFIGAMPADMQSTVKSWTMVELDDITGHIAKYLYPNSDVRIEGFEKAKIPNNYMDVAIGNVPFGNYAITDKAYPGTVTSAIHNYFFAKSLDKVRPGGLVTFITSRYTMDAYDDRVRKYLMDNADLLGAIRLPDTAFKGNAGTEVVTDIIVLRKRAAFTPYKGEAFGSVKYTLIGKSGAYINEYFADHPEMVLGTPEMTGSMYGKDGLTYKALKGDLNKQIISAFKNITGKMEYPKHPTVEKVNRDAAIAEAKGKEGSLVAKGSKIYKINDGQLVERKTTEKQAAITAKILSIRDTARGLLNMQLQGASEMDIKAARSHLNKAYDAFVKQHGFINAPGNKRLYSDDIDAPFITSLEIYDAKEKVGHKADIFSKNTVSPRKTVTHTDNAIDALIVSVNETGGVDMQRIAELTGNSVDAVSRELLDAELVYKNRDGAYETAEQYLSGNVKAKLRDAEDLLPADKDYQRNIDALKKIIPEDIPYQDIFVQPGATWVPQSVYSEFVSHMLNVYNGGYRPKFKVSYSALTGDYIVQLIDSYVKRSVENTSTWGTADKSFADLFSALLNNRRIVVSRKDAEGRSYVDKAATIAAQEKAEAIKAEFQNWIWEDEARRDTLAHLYNETFNNTVTPKYNGANLTVDGISAAKPLRAHQKDVVQRIISSGGNTLIAHKVGAGKTAEMAAAAMKLRQLGVVKKPMFVVPKSVLAQWGQEFISFFPNAKILLPGEQDFTAKRRREFMNKVATGDYDAIIVSQENFSSIPVSADTEYQFVAQQLTELEAGIEMAVRNGQRNDPSVKQMEKKKKQFEARLEKLNSLRKDEGNISFEELGVDSLFVDEAHSYKNLFYTTNMNNVSGLGNKEGAKRSYDLYMKVRYLQQLNGGRGIVFATATPVMNSMSEMYIMQKYLQSDLLKQRGLETFDAWANMFGEVVTVMEMNPTGKGYRQKESFSRFKNLGELQQMFRSFADVLTDVPGLEIPRLKGGKRTVVVSPASQYQLDYIEQLAERADKLRGGSIDPKADNMLKITSEGRKLSYSQHIMDPSLPYEEDGKIMKCISNVYDIWKRTKKDKMAQLVFCDIATPKGGQQAEAAVSAEDAENVSIYDDMKRQLVLRGIPAKEIAFIHDADTQDKKNQLFDDVNDGKVRVLIGSTGKMGVGMNAQKRLYALHHLDAPWRPGDIEQREGRILRQGNINKEVEIFTYVTEKTFDARMWDNLERKASFINSIMNGDANAREAEDVGEMVLSFAEIKSIASGNPLIMEQFEVNAEITKLTALKRQHSKAVQEAKSRKSDTESAIATAKNALPKIQKDIAARKDISGDNFTATVSGTTFTDRKKAGEAIISALKKFIKDGDTEAQRAIGKIAGFDLLVNRNGNAVIRGESTYTATVNPESAVGTIQSIEAVLRSIETRAQQLEASISAWQADIAKLDSIISTPFERQSDLNKAIARNNEITNILNPPEAEAVVADYDDADTDTIQSMVDDSPDDSDVSHDKWNANRVGDRDKKSMPISDIINKMRHDFGIPIGEGRMPRKDTRGRYSKHDFSIRTRVTNDLPAVSHELGHHLDNVYKLTQHISKDLENELINQLPAEFHEKYAASKLKGEGLAEFVRRYLQNKDLAAIDYPLFIAHFENTLSADTLSLVNSFADEINAYYSLDEGTAVSSIRNMSDRPRDFRTTKERTSQKASEYYQKWVDEFHGIELFDRAAGSNAHMSAINSAYSDAIAYSVLTGDLTDANGSKRGEGLGDILSSINMKDKTERAEFGEYLVVRHGPERLREGMRIFADDRKNSAFWMQQRQSELETMHPEFADAAERLDAFQRNVLQAWGVETGLVSEESAHKWAERWEHYVPLNRAIDKQNANGAKRGFANQTSTIRKARGSGADIIHPVDNIINNTVKMINAGIRNGVMLDIRNAALRTEGLGSFIEKMPTPTKAERFNTSELKETLVDAFMDAGFTTADTDTALNIVSNIDDFLLQFKHGVKPNGNMITVLVDGNPEYWKVNDPMLLESLTSMSRGKTSEIVEWYGAISRLMTSNITGLNLIWSIGSNTVRDLGTLVTYSKDKNIVHLISGLIKAYTNSFKAPNKQDPMYKEFLAVGGGSESAYTADRDMTKNIRAKLSGSKKMWLNPIQWIEALSNIIERGPRYATYKMMRDAGMTPQEAIYESHNITVNFRRGGSISRQVNKVVPFFNASVQGVDRLISWLGCKDIPKAERTKAIRNRVGWYVAAYGMLGLLQWFINSRDDEDEKYYAQLSNYTKNNFWCIPIYENGKHTGEYITIPKPRELAVPATVISNLMELVASGNKRAFGEFDEYVLASYLPNVADDTAKGIVGFIRGDAGFEDMTADLLGNLGVIGIAAYAMANRDFLGKPIESAYYQNLEKRDRYNDRTSKLAYLIGQAFNESPIMVDYVGQQLFGGFWKTQKALLPMNPDKADYTLGLSNTYRRDSQYSTDLINDMYDIKAKAMLAHNSDKDNMEKAIAYKEAGSMATFYSNYNKLEGSSDKATRQIVLDMIDEFVWTTQYGERSEIQKRLDKLCTEMGDTSYMCSALNPYVKDDDGNRHNLTAAQYVEYQGLFNSAYWQYVEKALMSSDSTQAKAIAVNQARARARSEADGIMLSRLGVDSKYSSQLAEEKAVGLTAEDSIAFRSTLDEVDAKREAEGSNLSKSDVYEILDSMDLTDAQRAYLYGNLNYSEVSNIYYTSSDLNGWIAEKRSEGKSDGDIASSITKTYKALYLEYWRKHDTSGMREIKQKLMALNLRKKDKPYYTEDTFNKWLND